ncbi:intermembrane lipid transfer protein Vps13D [Diabrotica virgifera virgifera]|uniref:Vacuolar protein sorting-associated protein 13D isoform X1 n=2 Tax=Diabrotica virgifera virgifera TaxID=50390 RepID=A0A6P7FGN0_DIAVI|nr:intermembrane lipid transfer protein Vps13D [Diabrotica virgifera virgifera]
MLEGLVAWILNTYLGKYVELNTDQLSIALLSGKVELENLPLKKDALRHLGLPVEIKTGFIGKIQLQVPVSQIRSAPWVIVIEQLCLVATPLSIDQWDCEAEDLARHETKLAALDSLEAEWRIKRDGQDYNSTYYSSSYSSWYSYGAGVISDIIENLQLRVQDVHIRYEDSVSLPDQTFACGITLGSLIAQSCDQNWLPKFVHPSPNEDSFKILELKEFGFYWMVLNESESLSLLNVAKLAEAMSRNKLEKTTRNYVLPAVSAQAHLKRNRSSEPLRSSMPRYVCDLLLEEVHLSLVDWQYNQIVNCIHGLQDINRLRKYRRYKPMQSVKHDARAWWFYAISCFYPTGKQPSICKPKPTWESCLKKARENVKYVQICKKILAAPSMTLSADEKKIKEEVEWGREYEDLKILKKIVLDSVKLPQLNSNNENDSSKGRSLLVKWFPTWMGWYSGSSETAPTLPPDASKLEGEILQVLADTAEDSTTFRKDAVFGKFNFCLKTGTLGLCTMDKTTNESSSLLEMEFKNFMLGFLSKPRSQSHVIELSLDALFLKDKISANTMFPIVMGPSGIDRISSAQIRGPRRTGTNKSDYVKEHLFYLIYEKKPPNSGTDFRLSVKSESLDIVYQPNVVRWLIEFIYLPIQRDITQIQLEAMKLKTKKELMKNWEQIFSGGSVNRSTWELELDITAPQIIFVEQFSDQNSAMAVIDFGKLHLKNNVEKMSENSKAGALDNKNDEDDETYLTPCSTPPVSEGSLSADQTIEGISEAEDASNILNESNLHKKLYDSYCLDLTDLQILIGRAKDNWRFALNKGSSNLHVLDRFSISLQIERRVIYTSDPHYPSVILNAQLPKLVTHLNENNISSARNLIQMLSMTLLPPSFKTAANTNINSSVDVPDTGQDYENSEPESLHSDIEQNNLITMQFTIDQMSLEIQSRGRSIAELQIAGVKLTFSRRGVEMSIALTVHSLLLVDALQTFGADFELLVASHKHVGMDSMSGSIRDSEPTSPVSPASPDSTSSRNGATSPLALTQALNTLATSPREGLMKNILEVDAEALISIEIQLITGPKPMQIANIQFNNLDIIANQQTLVELMGFFRRVFPETQKSGSLKSHNLAFNAQKSTESLLEETISHIGTTEIIFDFHRLNVLLLRGIVKDGNLYGKKIGTATMSAAKIQATISSKFELEGSLGSLQVLDLTPEGQIHQSILSVGSDPNSDNSHLLYTISDEDKTAFKFRLVKTEEKDALDVMIRMASVWYTHSPYFILELQSCASEFKQYLSNLAKTIRTAATDMALGLVHVRTEALAQSLNLSKNLPNSVYSSAVSISENFTPTRRRSASTSAKDSMISTPTSPNDDSDLILNVNLDVELDSPVIVLPLSNTSTEVFVAHLGKITVNNKYTDEVRIHSVHYRIECYNIDVKDMNIYSLDIKTRRVLDFKCIKPEVFYNCKYDAKPILHDTILQLKIEREVNKPINTYDQEFSLDEDIVKTKKTIQVSGSIVNGLKVSLTRSQYRQILDTLEFLSSINSHSHEDYSRIHARPNFALADIKEEDSGISTLNMDPHVRAKMFQNFPALKKKRLSSSVTEVKICFDISLFKIELKAAEQSLINVSFLDFAFRYDKCHDFETNIQISLRSVLMEDLQQPEDSKHRIIVTSSANSDPSSSAASTASRSCPDVTYPPYLRRTSHNSLPDHLESNDLFGFQDNSTLHKNDTSWEEYPCTPPSSPTGTRSRGERNLVIVSMLLVDTNAPNFHDHYNSVHNATSVDFNCLDLIITSKSWVIVLDFFSLPPEPVSTSSESYEDIRYKPRKEVNVTTINVKSLNIVIAERDREIAKANISNVELEIKTTGSSKEVDGKLGSLSLLDLTVDGQFYRDKFLTSGKQAVLFKYSRYPPGAKKDHDAQLILEMASVVYVHTKRFIAEILAFFKNFAERQQMLIKSIQAATSRQLSRDEPLRLSLIIEAKSPIILLPVSLKSPNLIVVDLGQLVVTNSFKFSGDEGTVSVVSDSTRKKCLLDVMAVSLENTDLYMGVKTNHVGPERKSKSTYFNFGNSCIMKVGPSLLTKKFQLKLQIEQNLDKKEKQVVPDMSIYGQLSTLDAAIDLDQYKQIRGLLAHNLGEDTEHINPSVPPNLRNESDSGRYWTLSFIKLDLQNVTLSLSESHYLQDSHLTCINFIKSHLTIETFSNFCQDIDLVSKEILIKDTRQSKSDEKQNVFSSILQPVSNPTNNEQVQAEIHSRKKLDFMKVTILFNNLRLMGIFDWWERFLKYIGQDFDHGPSEEHEIQKHAKMESSQLEFELKLNITDSEIVIVEDSSQWDTNAVILKSTTVLNYRPFDMFKPLTCNLNNCEMFSCILGLEDETALSIIDPVILNIEVNQNGILEVQLQFFIVRLSYNDMCMFIRILNSLPQQILFSKDDKEEKIGSLASQVALLSGLGFKPEDCAAALEKCDNRLDDAALWLTNAGKSLDTRKPAKKALNISAVEVKANRISLCIIDDCGDSDVPLLELSFTDVHFNQLLPEFNIKDPIYPQGYIDCVLAIDYYNRVLSGWEPMLEPWKCKVNWEQTNSQMLLKYRLSLKVESNEIFNLNITSTVIELFDQVKVNWIRDYRTIAQLKSNALAVDNAANYRRRSPFVPFALKNLTGSALTFTTFVSELDNYSSTPIGTQTENWLNVNPGEIVTFSFTTRDKMRHQNSHKMRMHQIKVKVDGWNCLEPVTVDRVGVYFRDTCAEFQARMSELPYARIVFDVTLEGSARKLVTVRSALQLVNNLPQAVDIKLESKLPSDDITNMFWVASQLFTIQTNETLAIPLTHAHSQINIRPSLSPQLYTFSVPGISWTQVPNGADRIFQLATCHSHKGHNYRFYTEIVKQEVLIPNRIRHEPAHTIFLLPVVAIENLLPVDMRYTLSAQQGIIKTNASTTVHNVDPDSVELKVELDNFRTCNNVIVPVGCTTTFTCRVKLEDNQQRKLHLQVMVSFNKGAKLKFTVSAFYWIINKTGLPLVFRQSGTSLESAGQYDEHEQARMLSPFMFSFSDQDGSPTMNARVGKKVIWDGTPQWCANFHVAKGTQYRKLHVTLRDGRPDVVFIIGLEVRVGRGKYRSTNIITISPRYQLHNRTSYKLLFSQLCYTQGRQQQLPKSCLKAMSNSHMPFHWPNLEKEQLLCVSIEEVQECCWSGGLKIDTNNSMHVNIRDALGGVYFLRMEVVLKGATFFVVFTDADTLPPPMRVDNFSEVSIMFGQSCYIDIMHSTARAHSSVPYAWDEPTKASTIKVIGPGGVSNTYNMSTLGSVPGLTYENFIYIAFTGTFKKSRGVYDPNPDMESQELVLSVGKNTRVLLSSKMASDRSQLWRMTSEGYLEHEGSSPPLHPGQTRNQDSILVLDIENTAPQPNTYSRLMLRRIDPRRQSTQKWRFTEDGRLCCDHYNMCVQAMDGSYGLRSGNAVVLGLPQAVSYMFVSNGLPIEQAIERQYLRPGSGLLSVNIYMDGPTQVICIKDLKESKYYATSDDKEWGTISKDQRPNLIRTESKEKEENRELQFNITLNGIGISLVSRKMQEELLYVLFSHIVGETVITNQANQICFSIKDIQIDNQLIDTSVPVVAYITPPSSRNNDQAYNHLSALDFSAELQPQNNARAVIFKYLIIRLKKITLIIEEVLLLKFCEFLGIHSQTEEIVNKDQDDGEIQTLLSETSAANAKRYYFGIIKLIPDQIRLSVTTASKLPKQLQRIKRKLGLTLIKFEDAAVELEAFERKHPFETSQFLIQTIIKHFNTGLMWQAGIIIGSVDFIGNPLGLVKDVSEGISGVLYEGNVGSLVKNVTHGMSNSAAKITESLSDGLGRVAMDDSHEEMRQKIRTVHSGKSSDHILAGFKGLGFGLLGGATGIFKQVYEGASNDGIQGVISGLGKGVVGAVTKPIVGVLDFASETARAVRDSSRSKLMPQRNRLPRCVFGPGELLPKFNSKQSQGQEYLYRVNNKNYNEQLVAYEILGSASEDLMCIVSNKILRIVTSTKTPELTSVIECHLSDLEVCNVIKEKEHSEIRYYIEIVMRYAGASAALLVNTDPVKKPRVRCRTLELADTISKQINYAKRMYNEHLYTLVTDNSSMLEE